MREIIDQFAATIRQAAENRAPLCIRGGGTKDFYGAALRGEPFPVTAYRGIVDYEPTELVLTARAGTPLAEIEDALAERGQMLAFEPPHFEQMPSPLAPFPEGEGNSRLPSPPGRRTEDEGKAASSAQIAPKNGRATLGGCIAAGLSGPRRSSAGSVRDFVLGVRMLDGRGSDLRFGGQVMKNVAGFDLSRLLTGSLGTLGVILEVSLKVLPLPVAETTLRFAATEGEMLERVNAWAGQPLPVSATAWHGGELSVRLSGAAAAVDAAARQLGGERAEPGAATAFWHSVREQTAAFFQTPQPLWRLSLKPTTPPLELPGATLVEWGGALRWVATDAVAPRIRAAAAAGGGQAILFRAGDKSAGVFDPLAPAVAVLHHNLKRTFDPAGIFNPGRMYAEF